MENLPSLDIKTEMEFDPSLEVAYKEAELKQNLTPLIKQELKYTILNRRHKSGQGELVLEEKTKQPKRELTAEEIRKKLRRKEQNRRAAARCRQKKKCLAEHVIEEYLKEQQNAASLQQEIEKLRREKDALERALNDHAFTCMRAPTPTPVTPGFDDQSTFQYAAATQSPYPRDSLTPNYQENQDPFDDPNLLYYPEIAPNMKLPVVNQAPTCTQTCTQTLTDPLSDLDLPLLDLNFFQPASPDIQNGGRTSISEYIDSEIAGVH